MVPCGEQIEIALAEQRVVVVEVGGLRLYEVGGSDLLDDRAEHVGTRAGADLLAEPGAPLI